MDFFEHQDKARRRTGRLIWFLALAVVGIIAALYLVVWFGMMLVAGYDARPGDPNAYAGSFWHPELFLIVAAGTLAVILLSSLYKTAQLASGGHAVAVLLGARRIDPQTHEPAERRLLNVVEEMALAAGMPVPPVYMMDAEAGINAFAAGHDPRDAVIGVTHGCLKYLDRDELQGVIAHEFSHILNGDMRLNLRLVGILYGILVLALIGRIVLRSMRHVGRSRSRSRGNGRRSPPPRGRSRPSSRASARAASSRGPRAGGYTSASSESRSAASPAGRRSRRVSRASAAAFAPARAYS